MLAGMPVSVGTTDYEYAEVRNGRTLRFKAPEKQIAAVLLDQGGCDLISTTFTKRGDEIETSPGYTIEPIRRASGIRWNNWATEYRVTAPEGLFVLTVKYPYVREPKATRKGRRASRTRRVKHREGQKTVEVVHTPYSEALRTPEMVARGVAYLHYVVARSRDRLRTSEVRSRAFPELLVTDVPELARVLTVRRAPNEHMDPVEFSVDPAQTTDRIHVIIGANGPATSAHTCSVARACGLWQFTEGTYRKMRRLYPEANLLVDFEEGWRDHVNIAAAALLLDDTNLAELIEEFGPEIAGDPLLEEYLAAAYNAGVTRVIAALRVARAGGVAEWTDARRRRRGRRRRHTFCIPMETRGFIAKLRYLRDEWPHESNVSAQRVR
jgi:hypothetical protein